MGGDKSIGNKMLGMLKHAYRVFISPSTPMYVKIVLAAGLLYALSPYDVIPEWIPVIGVLDDLALAALLIGWANKFEA
ncbi:YkvA family protein [Desulfogranum japonicum]|uniref:YkvA family protein n=1 Tax=Desulfogranum japonicum TaxID=231447 RepID=UPI00040687F5|nr:DUF1232 domain-containing protein [Desulfogranum japonicum]